MSRRAEYHILHRFAVTPEQVAAVRAACSPSGRFTWVAVGGKPGSYLGANRTAEKLRIHTLIGVPGKHCDVLLPDLIRDGVTVCEIGEKIGAFDGAKRVRLAFRWWPHANDEGHPPSLSHPGPGRVVIECEADQTAVVCLGWFGMWANSVPRLRFTVDQETDLRGLFLWQWSHHFAFLPEEDVRQDAEVWLLLPQVQAMQDIVLLNRLASQMLYDRAVQMGWRKLTLREAKPYHLSSGWHRTDSLCLRGTKFQRRPTGAGQYTTEAASGSVPLYPPPETIQTSYGPSVVE